MLSINDRIDHLISLLKLSKKDFALAINCSPSNITDWVKGRYKPSIDALATIESTFNVSHNWLMYGTEPIFNSDVRIDFENDMDPRFVITDEQEIRILLGFRDLTYEDKYRIEGMIEIKALENRKNLTNTLVKRQA